MTTARSAWLWEQHCCLPLHTAADIAEIARYPAGTYASVNIGYAPQSKAAATGLAEYFRRAAVADGRFRLVADHADIERARAEELIALAFDLEDSGPLEGDLRNVEHFRALGVRSLLPSYNHANAAGCGCLDTDDTGLTSYGRDLVREMNAVGMFVDGSHCSIRTGLDLAEVTQRPMIYSHSNFAGLWAHPRNITDDQARACAGTGGVIGINGVGIFLGANEPQQHEQRLTAMADHIEYGAALVGIEHIGVGSDYSFDHADFNLEIAQNPGSFSEAYTAFGPLQWVPPEDTVRLGDVLAERGFDEAAIAAVLHGNFDRIARQVWSR
jgi:membrane dipeptidase